MKGYEIRDSMNGVDEPRGKTWFWELEAAVLNTDRCVQCGTCVAVCPSNSLAVSVATNLPELVKMCTGCSLCWDFCPRAGLRAEATWLPEERGPTIDGESVISGAPGEGLGAVVERYAARSRRGVEGAQDGGAVTTILAALLDAGTIDGAVVSRPSARPDEPWKGVATVATTRAELARAAGSFYNQTMALAALDVTYGRLTVERHDGTLVVDEPVKAFHGAALKGCDECADFLGRGADLSVGSVGSAPGWSSVLVRTEAGRRALAVASTALELADDVDTDALLRLDALDKRRARAALGRELDPDGPLFVDFEAYLAEVDGTARVPVVLRR